MRTTATRRYARWSAAIAMLIALVVAGLYVRRDWQTRQARKDMPAAVPPSVQQQSAGFSFSKVEGDHTEFTVRASRATEYAGDGHSLLEDVWVTLYGKAGDRLDNLRTHSCEYMVATGDISCAGKVQIDLQGAEDARRHPGSANHANPAARIIHVDTSGIVFNQKTGSAATDQAVAFRFPQGDGRGVGFRYDSGQGQVQLLHDVHLVFHQQSASGATQPSEASAGDLSVTGSGLTYFHDELRLRLFGPVSAHQGARELSAEKLEMEFDSELRPRRLVASGNPVLREAASGSVRTIAADEISAAFSPNGWIESSTAAGNVHAVARSVAREDHLDANRAQLAFAEVNNHPQRLTATGNVRVQSILPKGATRHLETSEMVLDFAKTEQRGAASIERVKTPAAAMDFQGEAVVSGQNVPEHIHMTSQHLDADFGAGSQLHQILGGGGVEVRRQIGDQPLQVSASRDMIARFAPDGGWSTVDQTGDVRLSQEDRTASADRAHFDHASDTVALAGAVALADSRTRTTAQSGVLRQGEHEFRAEGRVVSNDISAANSPTNLGAGPARLSADRMVADTATGHTTYSGGARLWQGDSLVEANTIELDRSKETITATGRVHSVFPQARWSPSDGATAAKPSAVKNEYWHTQTQHMTYDSQAGHGHLEGDVLAESDEDTIRSDRMDLFFAPVGSGAGPASVRATTTPSSVGQGGGGKQLVRATAYGHVIVDQEDRHGTATHADYAAEAGKIALSGGPPTVHDSSGNVTTGRQLTFYFRDDTIGIDSAEGMRTLTLHRVEK